MINKTAKKELCKGCRNNYYNQQGNSPNGECWSLKRAKVVKRKKIHKQKRPPWDDCEVVQTLSCYHNKHFVYYAPDRNSW